MTLISEACRCIDSARQIGYFHFKMLHTIYIFPVHCISLYFNTSKNMIQEILGNTFVYHNWFARKQFYSFHTVHIKIIFISHKGFHDFVSIQHWACECGYSLIVHCVDVQWCAQVFNQIWLKGVYVVIISQIVQSSNPSNSLEKI